MVSSIGKWSVVAVLLVGGQNATAGITVYDAAADFSPTSNANGAWSYGYSTVLGSAFSIYDTDTTSGGIDAWSASVLDIGLPPKVSHNGTASPITNVPDGITWGAGQLSFHPGPLNEQSIVRWTSPSSWTIDISASFVLIDTGAVTTDVHVLYNSVSIFDSDLAGFGGTDSFMTQIFVNAGDTIDFVVGFGMEDFFNDTTGLDAVITVVPAPPALSLLAFAGLLSARRRRRK